MADCEYGTDELSCSHNKGVTCYNNRRTIWIEENIYCEDPIKGSKEQERKVFGTNFLSVLKKVKDKKRQINYKVYYDDKK